MELLGVNIMTSLVKSVASDQKGLPHWYTFEQTFHPEDEYIDTEFKGILFTIWDILDAEQDFFQWVHNNVLQPFGLTTVHG